MSAIFQGTSLDIYVHWLILALGIAILISGIAVITTCRSVAGFFHLLKEDDSFKTRLYKIYFKYHSFYWVAFFLFLALHLMVTIVHIGLPEEPYLLAHRVVFYTAITNFILVVVVFTSCKSFFSLVGFFSKRNLLSGSSYKGFYKFHSTLWWLFGVSLITHIIFGIIHALNT